MNTISFHISEYQHSRNTIITSHRDREKSANGFDLSRKELQKYCGSNEIENLQKEKNDDLKLNVKEFLLRRSYDLDLWNYDGLIERSIEQNLLGYAALYQSTNGFDFSRKESQKYCGSNDIENLQKEKNDDLKLNVEDFLLIESYVLDLWFLALKMVYRGLLGRTMTISDREVD
ncbi:hypothetical protein MP638_004118 [Amoeboaphelidium occidentale]|nr:hypothetical protein MP638_004118 [Amoeboaphelidium occidentale]